MSTGDRAPIQTDYYTAVNNNGKNLRTGWANMLKENETTVKEKLLKKRFWVKNKEAER